GHNLINHALHGIIYLSATSNKKSTFDRASFLPAELVIYCPFVGLFFVDFLRTFMVFKNNLKTCCFLKLNNIKGLDALNKFKSV
ncbi:hypothetical protein RK655_03300, partial [Streptococcus pneumoniae]|nr:hypothetical protein [Streptococcus pneumoniae]